MKESKMVAFLVDLQEWLVYLLLRGALFLLLKKYICYNRGSIFY